MRGTPWPWSAVPSEGLGWQMVAGRQMLSGQEWMEAHLLAARSGQCSAPGLAHRLGLWAAIAALAQSHVDTECDSRMDESPQLGKEPQKRSTQKGPLRHEQPTETHTSRTRAADRL